MQRRWLILLGATVLFVFFGCGDGEEVDGNAANPDGDGVFESDDPGGDGAGGPGGSAGGSGGMSASGGAAGSAGSGGGGAGGKDEAEKAIEEADIIQLKGTRLYALSKYGGLNVIDVSVKDQLKLLGKYKIEGEPFEMYVRDDVVLAMYSSFGHYEGTGASAEWVQSSAVIALNAADPAKIAEIGKFWVPGEISDSRIVGDVMYAVSYENGYCWNCRPDESTTVISLDVKVPSKVFKVDELAFTTPNSTGSWGKRSVTVTQNRMFVGGREYDSSWELKGSTIQIVDISDPTGKLVKGASVSAAGMIESRWQMDEKDGVLRLISQPGSWSMTEPPIVQTFQIVSSSQIVPLASMPMKLPEPERLRSVRFDGTRAYAITFRQTDPLFVIDLTDAKAPKQVGELQMPGWIFFMEPRGDRLLGLGFDQGNSEGSLNVSLFDVADATAPKLVDRVNFGGDWGDFAEDQDRIHKAFTIVDSLGVIFVPYSGWSYAKGGYGCGTWQSGIQIVDFTKDDLVKRGSAPAFGTARRAFLHQERLFSVSDVSVETFDIANKDTPVQKANLALANVVSKTAVAGGKVVRIGADWYTSRTRLDVTTLAGVDQPVQSSVDLEAALGEPSESSCWYGYWGAHNTQLFTNGNFVYVVAGWDERRIAVFDISGDTPVLKGKTKLAAIGDPYGYGYGYGYYGNYGMYQGVLAGGSALVQQGSTLVVQQIRNIGTWSEPDIEAKLRVIDLSNPSSPKVTTLKAPDGLGYTGLQVAGKKVFTSHWAPSPTSPGKVRFYVDRIDLATPSTPKLLAPINVPGSLLAVDATGGRAMTVSYQSVPEPSLSPQECYEKWGYSSYKWSPTSSSGTCVGTKRTAHVVALGSASAALLDSLALPIGFEAYQVHVGADRVFMLTSSYSGYGSSQELTVLSGMAAGKLTLADLALTSESYSYVSQVLVDGTRAVLLGSYPLRVTVVDAANAGAPSAKDVFVGPQSSYSYYDSYYGGATLAGDTLILSRGMYGVQLIDVTP